MVVHETEYMGKPFWALLDDKDGYRPAVEANLFLRRHLVVNHSPNTIKNYAFHLKTFYEFMQMKGIPVLHIADNLFQDPGAFSHRVRQNLVIDKSLFMVKNGEKPREAIGIRIEDLTELESRKIKLVPREDNKNGARIKNYAGGTLFCPPYVINNMTQYIVDSCCYNKSGYLFVNQQGDNKGEPMSYDNVQGIFERLGKKIGLPDLHPHILRHGFATEKIWYGWSLLRVSRWLRHRSIESTQIYVHVQEEVENSGGPIGTFDFNRVGEGGILLF